VYTFDPRNSKFDEEWPHEPGITIQIETPPNRKHFLADDKWHAVGWRFAVYSWDGHRPRDVQPKYNWLQDNATGKNQWSLGGTRKNWDFIDFADETLAAAFRIVFC
jgi:hypothetical protein